MLDILSQLDGTGGGVAWPLTLRRAWTQGPDALSLEYADSAGGLVPGRWMREGGARLKRATRSAGAVLVGLRDATVVLHPRGADADLPGLAGLLEAPGALLLSHRPGRRAVVRLEGPGGRRYAKALRPSKLGRALCAHEAADGLAGRRFDIARLAGVDGDLGVLRFEELAGTCLHDLGGSDAGAFIAGCRGAGEALRSLHDAASVAPLPHHDAGAEARLLGEKLESLRVFAPDAHGPAARAARGVLGALRGPGDRSCIIHRDFYDKQTIVGGRGIGLLDLDTLARGEAALDVGNMLAHLELRELQEEWSSDTAARAAEAFLAGYGAGTLCPARVAAYRAAALLRLAMLFALWPRWADLSPHLLERVGAVRVAETPLAGVAPAIAEVKSRGAAAPAPAPAPAFFVVGCPRSGTTLLERMLDAHPDVAVAHETHWITGHAGRGLTPDSCVTPGLLDRLYDDHRFARMAPDRDELYSIFGGAPVRYADFVQRVFAAFGARAGKRVVGDKSTGGYLRNIPELVGICPHAKVVHLVRDGRDVCLSMLTWPKAHRAAGRFPMWQTDPLATTAAWWRWHIVCAREGCAGLGAGRWRELRYEALVAAPEEQCAKLCAFLGLPRDERMARFHEGRTRPDAGLSANAAWLPPTPGLRDWRTQMTRDQIELFEAIAGDALEELGYERRFAAVSHPVAAYAAGCVERWEQELGEGSDRDARAAGSSFTVRGSA